MNISVGRKNLNNGFHFINNIIFTEEFLGPWSGGLPYDILRTDWVDFRTRDNAVDHRTLNYESVHDYDRPTPIYRRGQPFFMNLVSLTA